VFAQFKQHGLSVDMIGSAETNVTVSLDPTENLLDSDALAALASDLAKVCRVKVIAPCAAITLVGRGMRSMLHTLSSVLAEFGQLRVHMISQSSNNLNLTFVVDENVVDELLPHLHELLITAGALGIHGASSLGAAAMAGAGAGPEGAAAQPSSSVSVTRQAVRSIRMGHSLRWGPARVNPAGASPSDVPCLLGGPRMSRLDPVWATAAELSAAYTERTLSPVDAVEALLERIRKRDAALHAFIAVHEADARLAASCTAMKA